jgi:glycogen synthase
MRVLMFGWEFPPFNSGGLGTACYGLVKSLSKKNIDVSLVLPFPCDSDFAKIINGYDLKNVKIRKMDYLLKPYITSSSYSEELSKMKKNKKVKYSSSLIEEVKRYAEQAYDIAAEEEFDVIHSHDWLTYEAGIIAKEVSKKPLVIHVHATEFDRCGGNWGNSFVYEIEKRGMEKADLIITVSHFTKERVMKYYGINSDKIRVVHNAVEDFPDRTYDFPITEKNKIVLFLGRLTVQKGPDYFIYMSKIVSDYIKNVKFVVAGDGDMKQFMINKAGEMEMLDKYLFTGFLRGEDIQRAYKIADVYVMPSVSEPFGITPLEAIANGTPSLISKQSGVSEVVVHALRTDFWDVEEMANKIVCLLKYKELHECLKNNGLAEIKKFTWDSVADKCIEIYNEAQIKW